MSERPPSSDVSTQRLGPCQPTGRDAVTPVTPAYGTGGNLVLERLNDALADEIACVLRYRRHHFTAIEFAWRSVAQAFLQHAIEEQGHADTIATRIVELGGVPARSPEGLAALAHSEYTRSDHGRPTSVIEMLRENLVVERMSVDSYRSMVRDLGDDPTTRRMVEDILAVEQDHARDLAGILDTLDR